MSIFTLKPIIDLLYSEVSSYVQEINDLKDKIAALEADNMMLRDVLTTPVKLERPYTPLIESDTVSLDNVKTVVVEEPKAAQKKGKPRVAAKEPVVAKEKEVPVIDDAKFAKAAETFGSPSNVVVNPPEDKEQAKKDYQKEYQRNYRKMKKEKGLKA
jgi:hypothetical protein